MFSKLLQHCCPHEAIDHMLQRGCICCSCPVEPDPEPEPAPEPAAPEAPKEAESKTDGKDKS